MLYSLKNNQHAYRPNINSIEFFEFWKNGVYETQRVVGKIKKRKEERNRLRDVKSQSECEYRNRQDITQKERNTVWKSVENYMNKVSFIRWLMNRRHYIPIKAKGGFEKRDVSRMLWKCQRVNV